MGFFLLQGDYVSGFVSLIYSEEKICRAAYSSLGNINWNFPHRTCWICSPVLNPQDIDFANTVPSEYVEVLNRLPGHWAAWMHRLVQFVADIGVLAGNHKSH